MAITDVKELAKLVEETRAAQNKYFKDGRTKLDLDHSKALERKLDAEVKEILHPSPSNQTTMF